MAKAKKRSQKRSLRDKIESKDNIASILPLAFILMIVPLIVYLKVVPLDTEIYIFWTSLEYRLEFNSYYKMMWFIIATVISTITLIFKFLTKEKKLKRSNIYIPIAIYSLFVILSTIFSDYKAIAVYGFADRFEGMLTIIGYMIILFITINLVDGEKQIKVLLASLTISAIIISIIGVFQFIEKDIFNTLWGQKLILPRGFHDLVGQASSSLEQATIYSTLSHSNYVGSYMAMLIPIAVSLFLILEKKTWKIGSLAFSGLLVLNLIGSRSRAGIIGLVCALIVIIIFLRREILKNWRYIGAFILVGVLMFTSMDYLTGGILKGKVMNLTIDARIEANRMDFQNIVINNNEVDIIAEDESIKIVITDTEELEFRDDKGNYLDVIDQGQSMIVNNPIFENYRFNILKENGTKILRVSNKNINLEFLINNNKFTMLDHRRQTVDLEEVPSWGFEGRESLGSARGYIWSRSIPLLKDTMIIGKGPDTFALYFPNHDYIGRLRAYGFLNVVVDKAHNMYLQTAINTGIISLLALLAIFSYYIYSSIKIYWRRELSDTNTIIGISIFFAICGYLAAGLFNDSVVSVAPVFWILLGMGQSINISLSKTTNSSNSITE
ncbi:O-Antigen ligase [Natronincola peptidivorans]|uniref:O-Antigen ligase n=1 Tax=Natronincola peptidivorans TaxID=426128 RepID=A0A1I0CQS9_9FIRM|nr:O-antigen ligase family protein [Natronincola peptidivorans]SET22079.1 O-Antigen ligase [Natronincola peptidivorans]